MSPTRGRALRNHLPSDCRLASQLLTRHHLPRNNQKPRFQVAGSGNGAGKVEGGVTRRNGPLVLAGGQLSRWLVHTGVLDLWLEGNGYWGGCSQGRRMARKCPRTTTVRGTQSPIKEYAVMGNSNRICLQTLVSICAFP